MAATRGRLLCTLFALAGALTAAGQQSQPTTATASGFHKYAYIVYFTPANRDPLPTYRERLDRILTDVQDFYRRGMERNGFGPLTFPLERDAEDRLIVHMVRSQRPACFPTPMESLSVP